MSDLLDAIKRAQEEIYQRTIRSGRPSKGDWVRIDALSIYNGRVGQILSVRADGAYVCLLDGEGTYLFTWDEVRPADIVDQVGGLQR